MARRDVELVIRARDQAKAAIDSVAEALAGLAQVQERVSTSGERTDSILGRLGSELSNLNRQAQGLTAFARIATQLDRGTAAVKRLETELASTEQDFRRLSVSSKQSATSLSEMAQQAARAGGVVKQQRQGLQDIKREQALVNSQVATASVRYRELTKEFKSARQPSDQLRQSVRDQQNALISLVERQSQVNASVKTQTQAVRAAAGTYKSLQSAVTGASKNLKRLNGDLDKAGTSATAQATALEKSRQELSEIQTTANAAASALGGVEASQNEIREASQKTATAISRVTEVLRQQTALATSGKGASGGPAAQATAAYRAQAAAVGEAERALRAAREEANRLGTQMSCTASPTATLRAEFVLAQAASRNAARNLDLQREAMARLRQQTRSAVAAATQSRAAMRAQAQAAREAADAFIRSRTTFRGFVQDLLGLRPAAEGAATSLRRVGSAGTRAEAGLRKAGDGSRRALSIMQRLRGEVLALTTGFLGLYAVVTQTGGVISALRAVEAAQSRLGAVFAGDSGRVREELRFIAQEADRLGLSFRVLAQEYGKFSIAAQAANFESAAIRRLFIQVAEAARVNKASTEELEGIFLALQQIVSKGVVSMEELRRQLGDRLPGAFNIFADALGVTTAELDKMLRAGEVIASQETLLKFGDELQRRFGPGLAGALQTTTTEIDRFGLNLFEAQNRVAEGGFADALREALERLNKQFRSREGRDFFLQLGVLLGHTVDILSFFAENIGIVTTALKLLIGVKVGLFLATLRTQLQHVAANQALVTAATSQTVAAQRAWNATVAASPTRAFLIALSALGQQFRNVSVAVATTGVASTATSTAFRGLAAAAGSLAVALRGLLIASGIGILFVAATFIIGEFFGRLISDVPRATQALDEHARQLDIVQRGLREAAQAGEEYNATLADVSLAEAERNLDALADAYKRLSFDAGVAIISLINGAARTNRDLNTDAQVQQLQRLARQLLQSKITALEFRQEVNQLFADAENPALRRLAAEALHLTDDFREVEEALGASALIAEQLGSDFDNLAGFAEDVGVSFNRVTGELDAYETAAARAAARQRELNDAIHEANEFIPELAREQERAKKVQDLNESFDLELELGGGGDEAFATEERRLRALAALRAEFAEEDRRRFETEHRESIRLADRQRDFNVSLERANEIRRFELSLIGETVRQQIALRAVFEAQTRAQQQGLRITQEQVEAARESALAAYDAAQAERTRLQVLERQRELRKLLGDEETVKEEITAQAIQRNIDLTTEQGQRWAEVTRRVIERERAVASLAESIRTVARIERERDEAARAFSEAQSEGEDQDALQKRLDKIEEMRVKLVEARDRAIELAQALGDEEALARMQRVNAELDITTQKATDATRINKSLARGLTDAVLSSADAIGAAIEGTLSWGDAIRSVGDAFRQFAANFLRQIADMIIQALILRAIQQSGIGGSIASAVNAGVAHVGGIVGQIRATRRVPVGLFQNAIRMHGGGIAGLKSGEFPTILQRGEEVLARNNPRNALNGGGATDVTLAVHNHIDTGRMLEAGLATRVGEQAFVNFISSNRTLLRSTLGGG